MSKLDAATGQRLYRQMLLIRRFDERTVEFYREGLMGGSFHSYRGQEAIAVGCVSCLEPNDYMGMTYRGRAHFLTKGADVARTMAEMLGRRDGYSKGKGGSMHLADMAINCIGANGIVGAGVPIAIGAALASRIRGDSRVTVTFFGDGAINQGAFYEAANLADLWKLPIIMVCENNYYCEMRPIRELTGIENLSQRAAAFGFPGVTVDGNDVLAVRDTMTEAVQRARSGKGATLIEAKTYRVHGHMVGDTETYRTREEVAEWEKNDPITGFGQYLLTKRLATEADLSRIDGEIVRELEAAAQTALASPEPDFSEIESDLWV